MRVEDSCLVMGKFCLARANAVPKSLPQAAKLPFQGKVDSEKMLALFFRRLKRSFS